MVRPIAIVIGFVIFSIMVVSINVFWSDLENSYNVDVEDKYTDYFDKIEQNVTKEMEGIYGDMSETTEGENVAFEAGGGIKDKVVAAVKIPFRLFNVLTDFTTEAVILTGELLNIPIWITILLTSLIIIIILWSVLAMFFGRVK